MQRVAVVGHAAIDDGVGELDRWNVSLRRARTVIDVVVSAAWRGTGCHLRPTAASTRSIRAGRRPTGGSSG
ncbi:MAG: hypothetical protein M3680_00810 [Myxococcota bacterium]|nr:hypothetical protein [Myxococcota bacterium]